MFKVLPSSSTRLSSYSYNNTNKPLETSNKNCFKGDKSFDLADKALANYNIAFLSFKGAIQPELTYEYIKNLTSNPRDGYNKIKELESQIEEDWYNWKYKEFNKAFADFTDRLFKEADSVDELIKYRPDWTGARLREKFKSINNMGESFKFGRVPDDFINKETFDELANTITEAINSQSNSYFSKNYDIPDIVINNNTFKIKPLAGGKTGKVPCLITTPNGNKYVVKIDPRNQYNYADTLDLVDSVGLQAVIDYYLTQNNCQNSSKVYYYDEKLNASIYEYVEKNGDQSQVQGMEKMSGRFVGRMTDLAALGVRFNDTMGDGNVFVRDGNLIMVDNGHCTFDNPLKPKIDSFHKDLPNTLQFSCFFK
ncbi:MAG: hypothetical protein AB1782_05675 [Cyanobacteriota bacterium]